MSGTFLRQSMVSSFGLRRGGCGHRAKHTMVVGGEVVWICCPGVPQRLIRVGKVFRVQTTYGASWTG